MTQSIRNELIDSLQADHMLLAQTKGLTRNQAIRRHGLKTSLISVLPQVPGYFAFVLMNAFVVEQMYGIGGMAALFINNMYESFFGAGVFRIDIYITVANVLFFVALSFVAALFIDLLNAGLDPSIRFGGKKTTLDKK